MNPLYKELTARQGNTNMAQMMQKFNQFKNSFKGDPRQQIQQMLDSGKITQEQYNNAVVTANNLQKMLSIR